MMRRIYGYLIAYLAVVIFVLVFSLLRADTLHEGVRTFVRLLFIIGAVIAGIGAFTFVGQSRPGFREWYAHSAGTGSGRQVEIFLEDREKQRRHGVIIIIFGLALIGLSAAIGTLCW